MGFVSYSSLASPLSGPILCYIVAIPHIARYFFREVSTSPIWCDTPPCHLVQQAHLCDTPFCSISRDMYVGISQKSLPFLSVFFCLLPFSSVFSFCYCFCRAPIFFLFFFRFLQFFFFFPFSSVSFSEKFVDLLMGLFRGAVFHSGMGARKQPIKQPTELPTSTMALMGRFPSLMGRFPTLVGRFPDFGLRGRFTS